MKIAIFSDIHSNYYALDAVLKHSECLNVERYWVLGDIVGYGPHPEKCLEWFKKEYDRIDWVLGNHDAMLRGVFVKKQSSQQKEDSAELELRRKYQFAIKELDDVEAASKTPNQTISVNGASIAIHLNLNTLEQYPDLDSFWKKMFEREHLGPKRIDISQQRSSSFSLNRFFNRNKNIKRNKVEYWLVHGSRKEPLGEYIYPWTLYFLKSELQNLINVVRPSGARICQWHGHSHVPYLLALDEMDINSKWDPICVSAGQAYPLGKAITIANPGSVGQPRNGDTRACYAILDTDQETSTFYRVDYEWSRTAGDMQRGGYDKLIKRLANAGYPTDNPPNQTWIDYMELQKKESSK